MAICSARITDSSKWSGALVDTGKYSPAGTKAAQVPASENDDTVTVIKVGSLDVQTFCFRFLGACFS